MKNSRLFIVNIVLLFFLFSLFFFVGCGKDDATGSQITSDNTSSVGENEDPEKVISEQQTQIDELKDQISQMEEEKSQQEEEIKTISSERDQSRKEAEFANRRFYYLLSGVLLVVLLLVAGFVFLIQKGRTGASCSSYNESICPRCGWKREPGETICKNPKCKTRF